MAIVALSLAAWRPWSVVPPSVLGHQPSDGREEPDRAHSGILLFPVSGLEPPRIPGQFSVDRLKLCNCGPKSSVSWPSPDDMLVLSFFSISDSQLGAILSLEFGNVWRLLWLSRLERGVCRWPLVLRGQECHSTVYTAHSSPHDTGLSGPHCQQCRG